MAAPRLLYAALLIAALVFTVALLRAPGPSDRQRPSSAELEELRRRAEALAVEVIRLRSDVDAVRAQAPAEAAAEGERGAAAAQARQAAELAVSLRRRVDQLEASRASGLASDVGQPYVSFITSTRNRGFHLQRLLNSIGELHVVSHECNFRVVIMDQGSTDIDVESVVGEWSKVFGVEADVVQVKLPKNQTDGFFRARSLRQGMEWVFEHNPNDIVFMIDVDMLVPPHFLRLARLYSVRGKAAFVPICFSLYEGMAGVVSPQHGFWRHYGFGNAGLYVSDAMDMGLYNEDLTRASHGLEDNHFVYLLKEKKFVINRPNVQGFFHVWHPRAAWGNSSNGVDGPVAIFTPRRPN
eukprot:m51a1_g1408 hypothetical protein (353) ;mRNA; r:514293-515794